MAGSFLLNFESVAQEAIGTTSTGTTLTAEERAARIQAQCLRAEEMARYLENLLK
jgi:adenylosuccinate synthase